MNIKDAIRQGKKYSENVHGFDCVSKYEYLSANLIQLVQLKDIGWEVAPVEEDDDDMPEVCMRRKVVWN